jgi:hypothetical protein
VATKALQNVVTLADQLKMIGPKGDIMTIADTLSETNEYMIDAAMEQANDVFAHQTAVPVSLGQIKPRNINAGAVSSAPKIKQVIDQIMLIDVITEVDEELVDNMPDPNKARWNHAKLRLEAAAQEMARIMTYGNRGVDAREIDGFITRYNNLALPNVAGVGGSGGASVLIIEWAPMQCSLIYPRGAKNAGIEDLPKPGKQRVTDALNNPFYAYVHQVKARFGISVIDDRSVQRICNITSSGASNNLLAAGKMNDLVYARNRLKSFGKNAVIYCNRDIKSQFDIYALDKANGFYMMNNITGEPLASFQGIPIRMVEQMLSTESAVS